MWSVALRVGGFGRGVGWFVVLWRPVCGTASVIRASQVAPLRLWRMNVVSRRLVCGVARGGAIHDARCRNGTCGRSRCVLADAGGASVGLQFFVGWFVASPVGAPFMTPGAGTAHVVGRIACRWMRAGRRLIVVSRRLVCGVARGGAIYDARCRNGTCGRSRCASADAGGAAAGSRHCVGHSGVTSGAPTFAGG